VSNLKVWDSSDQPQKKIDFTTEIIAGRVNYPFSLDLFCRALLQYNSDADEFSTNLLLNYIYREGSNLYLVYNELRGRGAGLG